MADTTNTTYGAPASTFNGSVNPSETKDETLGNLTSYQVNFTSSQISRSAVTQTVSNVSSEALSHLNPSQLTAKAQARIPSLMSIRTNVSSTLSHTSLTPPVSNQSFASQGDHSLTHTPSVSSGSSLSLSNMSVPTTNPSKTPSNSSIAGKPRESQGKVMEHSPSSLHSNSYTSVNSGDNDSMEEESGYACVCVCLSDLTQLYMYMCVYGLPSCMYVCMCCYGIFHTAIQGLIIHILR